MTTEQDTYDFPSLVEGTPLSAAPGIYEKMSRETYDRLPYISSSALKKWLELGAIPSKFEYWMKNRWFEPPTEAFILGKAVDTLMLEPGEFAARFCTVPDSAPKRPSSIQRNAKSPSLDTLAAIGYWNKFESENKGKTVLNRDQASRVEGMTGALKKSRASRGLFEACSKQVIVGDVFGITAKGEIDLWNTSKGNHYIIDVKTAKDATPEAFGAACIKYGYYVQAIFYLLLAQSAGIKKRSFAWAVVEPEEPYAVGVYAFEPDDIAEHKELYDETILNMHLGHKELLSHLMENLWFDEPNWLPVHIPGYVIGNIRRNRE